MSRIPEETLEQIAAANDIVEVIGSYFPLKRVGSVWRALCPFHSEKTPSFHVNQARQSYHCFGCGAGGSVFRFIMAYENLDFVSAVKRLAERAGIPLVEEAVTAEEDARLRMRKRLLSLHKEAADWFHRNLLRITAAAHARDYLKGRGFNKDIAVRWTLGYAPDSWDAFGHFAQERGFTIQEIVASGLVSIREDANPQTGARRDHSQFYDRFRDRLMFPIRNDYGEVIAFSGRVLGQADAAKYVNSPETMLFTKGNVLFGLHASKRDLINAKTAIVCEGQIDLISAFEAGVKNVVAPQGTAFTEKQASMLRRFVEEVVLCFDADAAGEKAAERSLAPLLDQGLLVRVATMPPGEDPDSLIRGRGPAAFREIIDRSPNFFDYQVARLASDADTRARQVFARKMAGFIVLIEDPVQREDAIAKTVSRLGILRSDFERMLPRKTYSSVPLAPQEPVGETGLAFEPPTHTMRMLCLLTLRSVSLRRRLRQQPWRALLGDQAGADLLERLIACNVDTDDNSADPGFAAFLATLDQSQEAYVTRLLSEKFPDDVNTTAEVFWRDFVEQQISKKLRQTDFKITAAVAEGLPLDHLQLQRKETLDLKNLFTDIPRPSGPPDDPF
ncbi:MAG TPA: DNA primase [Chthoniobacterales bacterium]